MSLTPTAQPALSDFALVQVLWAECIIPCNPNRTCARMYKTLHVDSLTPCDADQAKTSSHQLPARLPATVLRPRPGSQIGVLDG